jgi:hypothetical protein
VARGGTGGRGTGRGGSGGACHGSDGSRSPRESGVHPWYGPRSRCGGTCRGGRRGAPVVALIEPRGLPRRPRQRRKPRKGSGRCEGRERCVSCA